MLLGFVNQQLSNFFSTKCSENSINREKACMNERKTNMIIYVIRIWQFFATQCKQNGFNSLSLVRLKTILKKRVLKTHCITWMIVGINISTSFIILGQKSIIFQVKMLVMQYLFMTNNFLKFWFSFCSLNNEFKYHLTFNFVNFSVVKKLLVINFANMKIVWLACLRKRFYPVSELYVKRMNKWKNEKKILNFFGWKVVLSFLMKCYSQGSTKQSLQNKFDPKKIKSTVSCNERYSISFLLRFIFEDTRQEWKDFDTICRSI